MDKERTLKPVQIRAHGRVVIQCSRCNMYIHDNLRLNDAIVQCPFCGSNYRYVVKLEAKAII
jgi:Zn finger protein HypA/HybF involved in hydrogenase expression